MSKLWGGRFAKATDSLVHQFNQSLHFDQRLAEQDITGSLAWAQGLVGAGVLTQAEADQLSHALETIRTEFRAGKFEFSAGDEDIHTAVERRLIELTGALGGKLHTGRSRNDQVATDFRLWVTNAVDELFKAVRNLQAAICESASTHLHTPMPGYTHLQHAQPITWGHFILAHFWALQRDCQRLQNARASAAISPLGSAALAGTAFPIDREFLAQQLGFAGVSQNSLDGVTDRDFALDFQYACTVLGLHLSRLAEQLILYSTSEFGFVRLDDAYSTGSSIMPQKKNPDTLELTRGKAGRLLGNLTGLLAVLKGLPSSGYDKDLQEDKEPLLDSFDNLMLVVPVMTGAIRTLQIRPQAMAAQLEPGLLATDLADYLVRRGMPFRQAHHAVGQAVRLSEERGCGLGELTLADYQAISPVFAEDVFALFQFEHSLSTRAQIGGTAPAALQAQLEKAQVAMSNGEL
ncbi:MAG TPA: argininosuccinate lyase [Anaerolineales bacterium]|nr:argininosuccinate lyase [Anaerolineales bacterium]